MRALNFYSSQHHEQLLTRRKKCTIRLGDKTGKYSEGDIVWITSGRRYKQKEKIFYRSYRPGVSQNPLPNLPVKIFKGKTLMLPMLRMY